MESVFNQSLVPDEVVLMEDGPLTEGLEQAISELKKKHPQIVTYSFEENVQLGRALAKGVELYTHHPSSLLPKAEYIGPVDYYDTMPYIFQHSRINLNITLKSIHSGIPLRCMDIMGSGGFLLTNYQEDFLDDFQPGEDLVFYESEDDFLDKITYYLSHDAERRQIAANCLGKMSESHTFVHRVNAMLNVI